MSKAKEKRAENHLMALVELAKAVGRWYNAPNKEMEEFDRKEVREKYKEWCEYRHDYFNKNPFKDTTKTFARDLFRAKHPRTKV